MHLENLWFSPCGLWSQPCRCWIRAVNQRKAEDFTWELRAVHRPIWEKPMRPPHAPLPGRNPAANCLWTPPAEAAPLRPNADNLRLLEETKRSLQGQTPIEDVLALTRRQWHEPPGLLQKPTGRQNEAEKKAEERQWVTWEVQGEMKRGMPGQRHPCGRAEEGVVQDTTARSGLPVLW